MAFPNCRPLDERSVFFPLNAVVAGSSRCGTPGDGRKRLAKFLDTSGMGVPVAVYAIFAGRVPSIRLGRPAVGEH